MLILLVIAIILVIIIWYREFIFMMALNDSDYSGKSDKILWFILFLVLPLFAPFLFKTWKKVKVIKKWD